MFVRTVVMAIPMMLGALFIFSHTYGDLPKAWTMTLTTLAIFQWLNGWNCRSEHTSIFKMNPFSNPALIAATGMVIALQLFAVYNPILPNPLNHNLSGTAHPARLPSCIRSDLRRSGKKFFQAPSQQAARLLMVPFRPDGLCYWSISVFGSNLYPANNNHRHHNHSCTRPSFHCKPIQLCSGFEESEMVTDL